MLCDGWVVWFWIFFFLTAFLKDYVEATSCKDVFCVLKDFGLTDTKGILLNQQI